jgi:hypothetical protein
MKRYLVLVIGFLLVLGTVLFQPKLFLIALVGSGIGGIAALIVFFQSRRRASPPPGPAAATPPAASAPTARAAKAKARRRQIPQLAPILIPLATIVAVGIVVAISLDNQESASLAPRPALHLPPDLPRMEAGGGESAPFPPGSLEEGDAEPEGSPDGPSRLGRRERPVAAVPYEADLEYENSGKDGPRWHVDETVRIARGRFAQMSTGSLARTSVLSGTQGSPDPVALRTALGAEWHFAGDRAGGHVVAYSRVRNLPIDLPFWPPTHEASIAIGTIASHSLRVVLVPSNGSKIDMHAPANLVKDTDPPAERRQFGGEDILTVELDGLEDDASRRVLHLELAGWIGQTSIYGAIEGVTAWTIVKLLFGGVPGLLVAFFVTRRLRGRFPDPPAPQPA